MSWIKKELKYIKKAIPQICQGLILFALAISGLAVALLLRHFGFNGYVIAGGGVLIELIAILLCYILFRTYLKKEEGPSSVEKGKKKKN
ncbi:MAG: hypothetical protein GF353_02815 [Candidatus Lokiarchaeota archaeon]|nr:hypothetical protein [Candidatus Lokiarchaeota archaeon]